MAEATWGGAATPDLDWRMSAALENVSRAGSDVPEVTSLEGAVRAWVALDADQRRQAVLTPERPVLIDGVSSSTVTGDAIEALAERLPSSTKGN